MAIQIINTGTSANAGNGDSIRTAFQKVNFNFDYLEGLALGTSTSLTSSVQSVVRPMLVHDAHNGISASYNSINNRVVLALGNLNLFTATNIVVNTLTVINSAVMNDVVMSGKVYMGFVQGTDDINVVKYADDGSLTLSLKNTYGLGGSEIELEDNISGSFRIVHQNSGANRDQFQNGQNYIYDDLGRGINIGRDSTISFFAKNTFTNYIDPELRISTTGTFISNNLTIADTSINWGGNNFTYNADNELLLGNQYVRARTDRLTSGLYTASITTAGNLLLPGDIVLELDTRIPNGLTVTNYGTTFSSIGPFAGVGSFYFDGSSYLSVSGGSHFNLFTTTSTLEWFEKRTVANPVTDLTSWALGSTQQPTLDFTTFTAGTFTNSGVFFGGDIGLSFLSASLYNNWTHYAAVISTSSFKLFVNGAIQINTTDTSFLSTLTYSGGNFSIGGIIDDNDLVAPFQGYISNMRWDAREVYTATFVPPTSILTRNSSTRMLLQTEKFTNFIYDSSLPGFSQLQQVQLVVSTSSFIFNEQGQFIINQNLPYQGQELTGTSIRVDTDSDFYTQAIIKNASSATTATSDLIFVRNDGNAATGVGVLDIGINSSNYTEPGPYGIHTPGSAYMFSNDADLIIGTQSAGKVVKFHAGETTSSNAIAVFANNGMTFNKQLLVTENYPGILVIQTQNTNPSGLGAAFSAINDNSGYINFGINGTTASINANIGPSDPYINPQSSGDTLHIGAGLNIAFYSDNVFYNNGTATLFLSRVDQSATFAGHVLPDSDLAYDLGSTSSQWRSLYVGTSTVYFGGTPFTVSADGTISVAGNEVIATTGVTSITAGTGTAISTSTGAVTIWATGGSGAGIATTSTLVNGTYTVSLSNTALTQFPAYSGGSLFIQGPEIGSVNSTIAVSAANNIILTSNIIGSPKQWTFGTGSNITLPGGGNIIGDDYSIAIVGGNDGSSAYGDVIITTNNPFSTSTWSFGTTGELTLPSGGEITSNQITNEIFGTTTTSLTLVPGGATEAGQRLEIYATIGGEGNHLHLTAGESPTELYLGNDSQYVKLGSMGQIEISAQGGLTLWGEGVMSNAYLILPNNIDSSSTNVTLGNVNGDVLIQASEPGNPVPNNWFFGRDGALTFPDGTTQTTAAVGGGGGGIENTSTLVSGAYTVALSTSGSLILPGIEDNSTPAIDFFSGAPTNHIVTLTSDWTLKLKSRADGANEGHLWLEAGQNTAVKVHGNGSNVEIVASTGTNAAVWNFNSDGALTFPDGATVQNNGFFAGPGQNAVLGQNDTNTQVYTMQNAVGIQTYDSSTYYTWLFDNTGVMTIPSGGDITFDSSATSYIYGVTGIEFADGTTMTTAVVGGGAASTVDITDTNGLTTIYYPTFVENRTTGQTVRADVDLTYRTDDNILGVGNIAINGTTNSTGTTTGALTVAGGVGVGGDLWAGNIYSNGVQLTAGGGGGGVTSITAGTGTFVSASSGAVTVWVGNTSNLEETFESKTTATGVIVHDCTTNRLFYHTGMTGNFTANFTNLSLSSGEATSVSLVLVQGGTARMCTAVQIANTTTGVNLLWQGAASAPTGNASRTEVVTFSILCTGTNAYTVLGMLTSFGGA